VCPCDFLVGVSVDDGGWVVGGLPAGGGGAVCGWGRRARCGIGLEDVEVLELLVEDGERLEALGLGHLRLEPVLDLVLLLLDQVLVRVVEVAAAS
jgi:hypothetical protein